MIAELSRFTRMARIIVCCCAFSLLHPSLASAADFFISTQADFDTISTFGTGPRPIINNNGVIHPHPTRSGATISAGAFTPSANFIQLPGRLGHARTFERCSV